MSRHRSVAAIVAVQLAVAGCAAPATAELAVAPFALLCTPVAVAAAPLALLMHSMPWAEQALDGADRVLPMPLFPRRLRERGFNQSLELARRLAPVVDSGVRADDQSDLPRTVSLLDLTGADLAGDPRTVIENWAANNALPPRPDAPKPKRDNTLRAVVGQGASGVLHLDLRSQGPHALVGGTTGAGKSEFLQAWVLGMAFFGEAMYPEAIALFEDALARNPSDFGPAAPLAAAYYHLAETASGEAAEQHRAKAKAASNGIW